MPLPPPSAEAQVGFLQDIQRLLAEGGFTATYKFALLQALADLAVLRGIDWVPAAGWPSRPAEPA